MPPCYIDRRWNKCVCVNKILSFSGAPSEGASPGPVRRRVSDKSGVAIAGGIYLLIILFK